ncbi:peroxiredoxin [Paraconexibacter antarcticus]|uniref:Peroxiredoxin n=1 Tax=Paraconexibacter antarcticus TaxID=2949664 RepID=A0ABY5DYX5_9ACTN|nr:peroxiredoxin [Paraconexibacter antarcticus]UTI66391.1 peroxiredoxin [Paraconexibacter antarcticus]
MASLNVGDPAPDFELKGTNGPFKLSAHRGERIVLLFYPGDDTTVCTKQFCSYRDNEADMASLNAKVVGISTGDVAAKEAFVAKHGLKTELLADVDGAVAEQYGIFAKRLKMAKRTVFIIDEQGRIAHKHGNLLSLTFDDVADLKAALDKLPAAA